MFKNDREMSGVENETETVIAQSVRVEGDFISEGNMRIEGTVSGSVTTERDLLVGEAAKITANVIAKNGIISGELHGNLRIGERLELTSTAKVYGDIQAKVLAVAPGATMRGQLVIGSEVPPNETATLPASADAKTSARPRSVREKKIEEILTQQ